jgi:hypothetical protein
MHYYQHDLALVHDRGYRHYADRCAPGILEMLAPASTTRTCWSTLP